MLRALEFKGSIYSVGWQPVSSPYPGKGEAAGYLLGYFVFLSDQAGWRNLGPPKTNTKLSLPSVLIKTCDEKTPQPCASPPRSIFAPDPEYSEEARKQKFQGTTVLEITVNVDGTVSNISVVRFQGFGLDENAVRAVRQWKFEPAIRNGSAVPVRIGVEVTYRLY